MSEFRAAFFIDSQGTNTRSSAVNDDAQ